MKQTVNSLLLTHSGKCPSPCPVCLAENFLKDRLTASDYEKYTELVRVAAGFKAETPTLEFGSPVSALKLSARTCTTLRRHNILFIGDLVQLKETDFVSGSGEVFWREIKSELARFGKSLGMHVPDWPNPEKYRLHEH